MQLHELQPLTKRKHGHRIGRGGKRGTTSGRGTKGQRARAGHKIRPALRDVIKKLPKLRGYRFRSFRPQPVIVDLGTLAKHFPSGAVVDARALLTKKLIRTIKGRMPAVKILGGQAIQKKLAFRGIAFSRAARASVVEAGGTIQSHV